MVGAAAVTSLLGQRGSSRVRLLLPQFVALGAGVNFLANCSSGAVFDRDHSLLAAMARPGTDFKGGFHCGLIRGFSHI